MLEAGFTVFFSLGANTQERVHTHFVSEKAVFCERIEVGDFELSEKKLKLTDLERKPPLMRGS